MRKEARTNPGGARARDAVDAPGLPRHDRRAGPARRRAASPRCSCRSAASARRRRPTPIDADRLEAFGRAALRAPDRARQAPGAARRAQPRRRHLRKVLPPWAVRLLIGSLLLAPLLVTVDGFARARRRRQPVAPWLGWLAAAARRWRRAAAFAMAAGRSSACCRRRRRRRSPAGAIPIDSAGARRSSRPASCSCSRSSGGRCCCASWAGGADLDGPGAGAALMLVWTVLAALVWVVNPYAAACMVPAAHLWLLVAAPGVRLRRGAALGLVALLAAAVPGRGAGHRGPGRLRPARLRLGARCSRSPAADRPRRVAVLEHRRGCVVAALVLAWRRAAAPADEPASADHRARPGQATRAPDRSAARSRRCGDEALRRCGGRSRRC